MRNLSRENSDVLILILHPKGTDQNHVTQNQVLHPLRDSSRTAVRLSYVILLYYSHDFVAKRVFNYVYWQFASRLNTAIYMKTTEYLWKCCIPNLWWLTWQTHFIWGFQLSMQRSFALFYSLILYSYLLFAVFTTSGSSHVGALRLRLTPRLFTTGPEQFVNFPIELN